jgi:hypothetical protein
MSNVIFGGRVFIIETNVKETCVLKKEQEVL